MKFFYLFLLYFFTSFTYSQVKNNNQNQLSEHSRLPEDPIDPGIPEVPDPEPGATNTTLYPPLEDTEVGYTPGELVVTATGGAAYNIPIMLPPGINSVAPNISLNYNSQAGNSLAGLGWNIGGLSTITIVPSTLYHDGISDPVDFDSYDKLALNGQRLILKSGQGVGSTYETENFSNLKITHLSSSGLSCFKVEYPDGSLAYYGIPAPTTKPSKEFVITKWKNPQGLTINYEYDATILGGNTFRIKSINYGSLDTIGINKIEFIYKNKNKQEIYYIAGYSFSDPKILSQIKVSGNNVVYRNYYLTHDLTSTGYERLTSIQEKSGDNSRVLNPTTFTYNTSQSNFTQAVSYSNKGPGLNNNSDFPGVYLTSGDYTGNGNEEIRQPIYQDLYIVNEDYTISKYDNVKGISSLNFLNSEFKLSNKQGMFSLGSNSDGTKKLIVYSYNQALNLSVLEYERSFNSILDGIPLYDGKSMKCSEGQKEKIAFFGDYNGDKLTDAVFLKIENGIAQTQFINLDRRLNSNYAFNSGDINVGSISNCTSDNEASGSSVIRQGDFNGDGVMDLYVFRSSPYNKIEIYSLVNNAFIKVISYSYTLDANIYKLNVYPIVIGDFNGDGKSDILFAWQQKILNSLGTTFSSEVLPSSFQTPASPYDEVYVTFDIDNDGKSDITRLKPVKIFPFTQYGIKIDSYKKNMVWETTSITKTWYNTGLTCCPYDPVNFNKFEQTMLPLFARKKQQGLTNITELAILGDEGISYFNFTRHVDEQNLLKSINPGNGLKEDISYNTLKDGNGIYEASTSLEAFPYYNLLNGKENKIVSEIRQIFPGGPYKKRLFKYYGAVFDTSGRGISGFQATTSTNWFVQSSDIISTVSKYDFTKNGVNTETFSMVGFIEPNYNLLSTDSLIARTINTYNHEDTGYVSPLLNNKVFKLFKTKTENFNGLTGTSSVTNVNYNNYNNPINSTTTIKNGTTIEKTTTNTFNYDAVISSPYIVDRLNSKNSTTTVQPSGDVHTSEEQYVYDINLLKQIKKRTTNSGLTSDFITENNEYDTYGNLTQKKYSAPGMSDRITNYEYDTQSHRFITKKINAELQETLYEYNQNTGWLLSETAPSNSGFLLKTSYLYDAWGRVKKITDYLGKYSNIFYSNLINKTGVLKTVINSDGSSEKTISDPFGRVLHEGNKTIEDKWVVKSTHYNIYDQPIKITGNYFDGNTAQIWDELQYDAYGRLTQSNHLKTSSSPGKVTAYNYNKLITIENDGQKTKTTVKNAIGQIISLEDNPGEIVSYEYFANGNLKKAITSGSTIEIQQDAFGRKKTLIDPSAGTRNYEYNKFGELTKEEVVGKGFTEFTLDDNGKLSEKKITEVGVLKSKTTYNYNGNKQLSNIVFNDYANSTTINYTYEYDDYRRLFLKKEIGNQFHFEQNTSFDAFGRPEKLYYYSKNLSDSKVSSRSIKYEYKNSFNWKMYDMTNPFTIGILLWETKQVNENEDILSVGLKNNTVLLNKSYDIFGFPTQIKYSNNLSDYMVQNTEFDPIYGNLTKRTSDLFGTTWTEDLSYDQLDRLTTWKDNEGIQNQAYNGNGTITSNKIGNYAYSTAGKPFQVSTITPQFPSPVYDYYANREQNINYNINKKPVSITELNTENIDFEYNPMDTRSVMYYGDLQSNKVDRIYRKFYSADGSMEIKRNLNTNQVEFITYVQGSPYSSSVVLKSDGTNQEYLYLLKDYQGTINGIINTTGNVIEKRQFDVWGSLISFANTSGVTTIPTTANSLVLDRGYTGHEHLLGVNIINMNGRIYDNNLHKFLQPDNYIQDFYNTQNYNRYGYVMNNPTKYTDENGEFWQYLVAAAFSAYASGYQSSGDYNPFNWNSTAWTNAGLGAASFGLSTAATYYADNYISNYGSNNFTAESAITPETGINIEDTSWDVWVNETIWEIGSDIFGGNYLGTVDPSKALSQGESIMEEIESTISSAMMLLENPLDYFSLVGDNIVSTIGGIASGDSKRTAKAVVFIAPLFVVPEAGVETLAVKTDANLALGLGDDLFKFANVKGFDTYRDFSKGFDQEKILNAMHSYDKIHFNVTGFGKFQYSRFDPLGKINYTNYTNWEMHTIFNDSKLLEKTTFYKYNGSSYEILNNYSPKW